MLAPTRTPSARLLKAAQAERKQLIRHRRELLEARDSLRAELDRIEGSLQEVAERETLLDRLVGVIPDGEQARAGEGPSRRTADEHAGDDDAAGVMLRGPDIRREALRVVLAHPDRPEALHYRDWYSLLRDAGYRVAGKDPLATFLTQLSRAPAVRRGTQSGVYEVDRGALVRLRRRRDELQDELRAMTAASAHGSDVSERRARRTELNTELGRVEKALEEVETLFDGVAADVLAA